MPVWAYVWMLVCKAENILTHTHMYIQMNLTAYQIDNIGILEKCLKWLLSRVLWLVGYIYLFLNLFILIGG